jgi:hypothetical protein
MTEEQINALYNAHVEFEGTQDMSKYHLLVKLLKEAKKVRVSELIGAQAMFVNYPSSNHFRTMTALMLVWQHQN